MYARRSLDNCCNHRGCSSFAETSYQSISKDCQSRKTASLTRALKASCEIIPISIACQMLFIRPEPSGTHRRLYALGLSSSSSAQPSVLPQRYQPTHCPPLSANTKCSVAPPSRLYSEAILSSDLPLPVDYQHALAPFTSHTKRVC